PAHEAVQSGTSDGPEEAQEAPLLVPPFAGPDPIEALEKIRLIGPGSDREVVPPPERGPMPEEPPPPPQGSRAPVAPRDLVWADLPRLEGWLSASTVEEAVAPADLARFTMDEVVPPCPVEPVRLSADSHVSRALVLLAFLDLPQTWRRWEKKEGRRGVNRTQS